MYSASQPCGPSALGAPASPVSLPWASPLTDGVCRWARPRGAPSAVGLHGRRGLSPRQPSGKVVTSQLHGAEPTGVGEWVGAGPPNTALNPGNQKPVQRSCDLSACRAVVADRTTGFTGTASPRVAAMGHAREAGLSRASARSRGHVQGSLLDSSRTVSPRGPGCGEHAFSGAPGPGGAGAGQAGQ